MNLSISLHPLHTISRAAFESWCAMHGIRRDPDGAPNVWRAGGLVVEFGVLMRGECPASAGAIVVGSPYVNAAHIAAIAYAARSLSEAFPMAWHTGDPEVLRDYESLIHAPPQ